jgi:polysaccharide pyruvyl transferase WcaK-like protein
VIGSDEVWNLSHPWYGGVPLFYGDGIEAQRLVAYAGSFGSYSCHWGLDEYWTDKLRRFDALSVRDENSFWLVRGTTGREPPLVLDPVLQFPESVAADAPGNDAPYALVYGHSFPVWFIAALKRWARAIGLRLRSIGYHNGFADEQLLDAGPLEFARQMRGARTVITNFFHGCVFALVNGKPFAAVSSDYRHNKVRGLLSAMGVSDRLVEETTPRRDISRLLAKPPPPAAFARIAERRTYSKEFLRGALA